VNQYAESVRAVRWFLLLLAVAVLGCLAGALAAFLSEAEGRGFTAGMLLGMAGVLAAVTLCCARLRIEVSEQTVRFRFGPFGRTLDAWTIRSAEAIPYRWIAFGGWGVRLGRISGQWVRAYSVPFVRTGVALEVSSGRRYYVSSRHAEALASAIRRVAAREGQA
jgi:uncharacterized membrane protein YeaQ/YmgE (transglycosylase-associated protein family)